MGHATSKNAYISITCYYPHYYTDRSAHSNTYMPSHAQCATRCISIVCAIQHYIKPHQGCVRVASTRLHSATSNLFGSSRQLHVQPHATSIQIVKKHQHSPISIVYSDWQKHQRSSISIAYSDRTNTPTFFHIHSLFRSSQHPNALPHP